MAEPSRTTVEPRTPLEQSLARHWSDVLGLERIGIHDSFFDLGGHSLLAAELFARLEAEYGVRLPLASLFRDSTIERQAAMIAQASQPDAGSIVPITSSGRRLPFFCVHAIDGDVLRFEPLARLLGPDQPFYGIRAQGLTDGTQPIDDLEGMAAHYVEELLRSGFVAPFLLGGFSSGATVAFEMARQLTLNGHAVALLALFDGRAPAGARRRAGRTRRSVQALPTDVRAYVAYALHPHRRRTFVQSKLREFPTWWKQSVGRQPEDWDALAAVAGFSERHLEVARAQTRALRGYTPRPYPGRVTLFRARVRLLVSAHDRDLGWGALARGGVEVHPVSGAHAEILRQPDVRELADRLRDCLDLANARTGALAADPGVLERAAPGFVAFEEADVEQSVAARFEQQVEKFADRLAIKSDSHELTYAQLNRLANRMAHAVLQQRPTHGEQIGLLFEQQAPMIAASLAALKAGRLFVSLDPTYPQARQRFILDDAQVGIILTDCARAPQARELANGRTVINVEALDADLRAHNPGLSIAPDAYTYIVYTSGSTGQPKGVVENQRNVLHFTLNNTNTWHFQPTDRISMLVPFWFSAFATPTFGALLNGAALVATDVKQRGLNGLADWLVAERITIFHTTTSLFRHFARSLPDGRVIPNVRMIYQGSEALYRTDVELYKRHFADHCVMACNLGASEMKNFSSFPIDKRTELADRVVPVGYPLPGVEYYLVDDQDRRVGPGAVGEIVVRSRYIAPLYWRRPELSARAFRADPADPHLRLYYTGDLGRIDEHGCLHHVGRKDFQVKIRGYRVELGDVSAALLELPAVAEAVVVAQPSSAGETRLVAYVVAATRPTPTVADLRAALELKLPSYMVPAVFVMLDALPRNANGKLDNAAVAALSPSS